MRCLQSSDKNKQLFTKDGRGVRLTDEGDKLLNYARRENTRN